MKSFSFKGNERGLRPKEVALPVGPPTATDGPHVAGLSLPLGLGARDPLSVPFALLPVSLNKCRVAAFVKDCT